jgi:hypothetical protein
MLTVDHSVTTTAPRPTRVRSRGAATRGVADGVGPPGGSKEHRHGRQHRQPRQVGMEGQQVDAPERAIGASVDHRQGEVAEHHQHQRRDARHIDGAAVQGHRGGSLSCS